MKLNILFIGIFYSQNDQSLPIFSLFFPQYNDDPECFMGHRVNRVTLVIILSLLLTILLFTYVVYIRISITAASQRKRGHFQHALQQKPQKKIVR